MEERRDGLLRLCRAMANHWALALVVWGLVVLLLAAPASRFDSLATTGDLRFLPENAASRQAERAFSKAFDKDLLRSLIVICVRRTTREAGLTSAEEFGDQVENRKSDFDFIDDDLRPKLEEIVHRSTDVPAGQQTVTTFSDKLLGPLLNSEDGQASLAVLELPYDFRDPRNAQLVGDIEDLLYADRNFRRIIPPGLEITLSGTAPVGRDRDLASQNGLFQIQLALLLVSIALLLGFFRAPLLAFVTLVTAAVSVVATLGTAVCLQDWAGVNVARALPSLVQTVTVGLALVCSVYLIARYRNRLASGDSCAEATAQALRGGGLALLKAASLPAAACIVLSLTTHQRFAETGQVLLLGLLFAVLTAVSLLPSLLRIFEAKIFWPRVPVDDPAIANNWTSHSGLGERFLPADWTPRLRRRIAGLMSARPGRFASVSFVTLCVFSVLGLWNYSHLNYGLLADLPSESRSSTGSQAVRSHFPPGALGPTTVLLVNESQNFLRDPAIELLQDVSDAMYAERERLGLRDVFSVAYPLGMTEAGRAKQQELEASLSGPPALQAARRAGMRARVVKQYVGDQPPQGKHVTRINLMFEHDPFDPDSIRLLNHNLRVLQAVVDDLIPGETTLHAFGSTPAIRDMAQTIGRDQLWGLAGTLLLVLGLLSWYIRQSVVVMPLLGVHLLTALASLGITAATFWLFDGEFAGIDWKARTLLFSVLLGVSPALSFLLLERTRREQQTAGPVRGVLKALVKHGGDDVGAGLILAITSAALLFGSLTTLRQLGFGLAFGMLIDTFLVRMLLLPSYLILVERELFGRYSPWLAQRLGASYWKAQTDSVEKLSA